MVKFLLLCVFLCRLQPAFIEEKNNNWGPVVDIQQTSCEHSLYSGVLL